MPARKDFECRGCSPLGTTPDIDWLCTPNPYVHYCPAGLEPPKLVAIIRLHGFCFDDNFWYWITPSGHLKCAPIWTYPQKSVNAEKRKRFVNGKQLELIN